MRKNLNVVTASALPTALLLANVLPAQAEIRYRSKYAEAGNPSAGAQRSDYLIVDSDNKSARMNKNLRCHLFKSAKTCAAVDLKVTSSSGIGTVVVGGRTIFSKQITRSGSLVLGPYLLDVYLLPPTEIFSIGIASVKASANAGAGAQFSASYNFQTQPVQADLNGAAQTWGNAGGKIKAEVLFGAASAEVNATLNFFNTALFADLHATPKGLYNSHARFQVILWQLYLKFKAKIFGGTVASKTIVNETGPSFTQTLL